MGFGNQRDGESGYRFHLAAEEGGDGLGLGFGALDNELVVYLHNEAGGEVFCTQGAVHPHHGKLNDIGGSALNGHIEGHALAKTTLDVIRRAQFGDSAAATVLGGDIALFLALLHHRVHIGADSAVGFKIAVNIILGLGDGHINVLRQAESGHTVDDAEVHRLGTGAHGGGHLALVHMEHFGGGDGVEIAARQEGLLHGLIIGDVGEKPQLDLGVVGVHQDIALLGDEEAANLTAHLGAGGDILQIGLGAAQAARCRDGHLKAGTDAVIGVHGFQKTLGVGGVQLG